MKKLMIAAAAVAMVSGAFAADEYAAVYNLKYTLKTIAPKTYSCGKETCTICEQKFKDTGFYYENGTVKLEGLLAYCSECDKLGEDYVDARLAIWDPVNKVDVYVDKTWKTATLVKDVNADGAAVSNIFTKIDQVVYGKKSTKVAIDTALQATKKDYDAYLSGVKGKYDFVFDLRAAGLGSYKWDDNAGHIVSVNGNVAGSIPAFTGYDKTAKVYWSGNVVSNLCAGAAVYCGVDGLTGNYQAPEFDKDYTVPAYGTWSMKFNSAATKKALYKSLPSWLTK